VTRSRRGGVRSGSENHPIKRTYVNAVGASGSLLVAVLVGFISLVGAVSFEQWPHSGDGGGAGRAGGDVALALPKAARGVRPRSALAHSPGHASAARPASPPGPVARGHGARSAAGRGSGGGASRHAAPARPSPVAAGHGHGGPPPGHGNASHGHGGSAQPPGEGGDGSDGDSGDQGAGGGRGHGRDPAHGRPPGNGHSHGNGHAYGHGRSHGNGRSHGPESD